MAVAVGTQYQQLCEAVKNYYGAGSDQWLEIAQYGVGASDFKNIVSQVPGVNVTVARDGSVLGYSINQVSPTSAGGQTVSEFLNSNTMGGTNSAANMASVNIPASTGIAQGGTNATAKSGVTKVYESGSAVQSAKQFVTGEVLPAILAAATGISLAKTFDSWLYNRNPQMWDDMGMSTLNPETWNSITSEYDGPTVLKTAFNTIFGLDPNSGNMQMYVDDNAYAYMAQYLNTLGFFSQGSGYETTTTPANHYYTWNEPLKFCDPLGVGIIISGKDHVVHSLSPVGAQIYACCVHDPRDSTYHLFLVSNESFTGVRQVNPQQTTYNFRSSSYTAYGKTYYFADVASTTLTNYGGCDAPTNYISGGTSYSFSYVGWDLGAYAFQGGMHRIDPVPGTGTQTGATLPVTTGWNDPASTKTSLQTQYPDLWNNRLEQDVLQPDGTIKTITYIPVPMPDGVSTGEGSTSQQPTCSGETGTQANPEVNPNNTTDSMLQTLIDILTSPNSTPSGQTTPQTSPQADSETPLNPDEKTPDTGTGASPTSIVPTGGGSALWSVYNPSQSEVNALGAWLWSSNFVDQLLKVFSDPMQAIIGLHKVFATPAISGTGNIVVGYLDSGVSANLVSNQYTTVNCGSVNCFEYFGNVFDYSPHTRIHLYLPFIGIVELNCADVMRGVVSVTYTVDVITGACLAEVSISRDASGGVIYTYSGDCAVRYPVSSGSYMSIVGGILSIAGGIAATVATGGAAAPAVLGAAAGLTRMHTDVKHSGNLSGNAGAMGIKKPYLIISRPQSATAVDFNKYQGIGANSKQSVASMTGYFKMDDCKLESVTGATKEELEELRVLLKTGVIK